MKCSLKRSESGNFDALSLGDEVFVPESCELSFFACTAEGKGLHLVIIEGADSVDIGAGGELL